MERGCVFRNLSVPCLFVLACLFSGIYGALHNQISFSVSAEYFTKFKFEQFSVSPQFYDRWGGCVGWLAGVMADIRLK
ncbi:hypothetical protein Pla100_61120 [Neorhodopirellula pilleata]|uniref:Uncharacterized protein n=1 Tax=Neorhodopirellula pilleata TaxID=2714738 RepID=A0A5C5ZIJ7_9BACT|nr:hypothetical protein Pla100_61120 [Neorhodopirellula pilleata]